MIADLQVINPTHQRVLLQMMEVADRLTTYLRKTDIEAISKNRANGGGGQAYFGEKERTPTPFMRDTKDRFHHTAKWKPTKDTPKTPPRGQGQGRNLCVSDLTSIPILVGNDKREVWGIKALAQALVEERQLEDTTFENCIHGVLSEDKIRAVHDKLEACFFEPVSDKERLALVDLSNAMDDAVEVHLSGPAAATGVEEEMDHSVLYQDSSSPEPLYQYKVPM